MSGIPPEDIHALCVVVRERLLRIARNPGQSVDNISIAAIALADDRVMAMSMAAIVGHGVAAIVAQRFADLEKPFAPPAPTVPNVVHVDFVLREVLH